jgi:lipopolysaccharide export system protein LptC
LSQKTETPKLDTYSKFVLVGKLALFFSVATVSVFIFAVAKSNVTASMDAQRRMRDLSAEQLLSSPDTVGVTESGVPFHLTAERGKRDNNTNSTSGHLLEGVHLKFQHTLDRSSNIVADLGRLSLDNVDAFLMGNVRGTSTDGYFLQTENITANLDRGRAHSNGPILLRGPDFILSSNSMQAEFEAGEERYIFNGGVKILYFATTTTQ